VINLDGSPYLIDTGTEEKILADIKQLEERVDLLRRQGILTDDTLQRYYGMKRFEHVAESNAIEGSTLSAGETELAVLKGVTVTGHDPAYIRDAIALDNALQRLVDLAKDKKPTDLVQIREIHEIILGEHPSAGIFRNERVAIRGSNHTPPKTWKEVMDGMEDWEKWSNENGELPAIIRATVLHAWFVHVHPFIDGNGRTARALSNLELIRSGYPSIIIRKKERDRYIDALGVSDEGGDLTEFFELIISRTNDALRGLEQAAKQEQGYSPAIEKIRQVQERRLNIWSTSVSLLARVIELELNALIEPVNGKCTIKTFDDTLDLDEYIELCSRHSVSRTWSFIVNIEIPGMPSTSSLAWFGYRSPQMYRKLEQSEKGGPSIFWSTKNQNKYPTWIQDDSSSPKYVELTTIQGSGDDWYVMDKDHKISKRSTTKVASELAESFLHQLIG
jgi:Fic family protein